MVQLLCKKEKVLKRCLHVFTFTTPLLVALQPKLVGAVHGADLTLEPELVGAVHGADLLALEPEEVWKICVKYV